jgi:hypothetical protein
MLGCQECVAWVRGPILKPMMRRTLALVLTCAMLGTACGPSDSPLFATDTTTTCILLGPRVSPASATLHPGDTLRASVAPPPCTSTPVQFRWTSSDTAVATVGLTAGLIRALKPGTVTITAREANDPSQAGAMVVVVDH